MGAWPGEAQSKKQNIRKLFMKEIHTNSVRFEKVHLHNYGIFRGSNDVVFDRQRTIIVGAGGTGKTIIMNAIAHLGPAPGVRPNVYADSPEMFVNVTTSGDRNLVKRYGSIIFFGYESVLMLIHNQEDISAELLDDQQRKTIRDELRNIFRTLLERKPGRVNLHKDLNPDLMPAGEKFCFGYAFAFAVRKVLNLDLPAVFDSPYGWVDVEIKQQVSAFLKGQSCQQILLGHEEEFAYDDHPHYRLKYTGECSRIEKTTFDDR
jgi:ABC-type glutathione transport system ATPase component